VRAKRGCSAYPIKYPEYGVLDRDAAGFKYGEEWKFYEDLVDKYWAFRGEVDCYDEDGKGTDPLRELFALQFWVRLAASIGDRSYLVLTGGKELVPLQQVTVNK